MVGSIGNAAILTISCEEVEKSRDLVEIRVDLLEAGVVQIFSTL